MLAEKSDLIVRSLKARDLVIPVTHPQDLSNKIFVVDDDAAIGAEDFSCTTVASPKLHAE